ncbi:MAG: adenylyl-sulfate kinase [Geoalkalibacter sp.]|uniref:adenylyl-sulfate kinase n=1 Tax=Geoalkalibacter sp. TaxID=3041440 RepID=UPI003D12DDB6
MTSKSGDFKVCAARDSQGHYEKARRGEFTFFSGVDVEYEEPVNPEITIEIDHISLNDAADRISSFLKKKILSGKDIKALAKGTDKA